MSGQIGYQNSGSMRTSWESSPVGIQNGGGTCYVGATLQVLLRYRSFAEGLDQNGDDLHQSLLRVLFQLRASIMTVECPVDIIEQFGVGVEEQVDLGEFMLWILDHLFPEDSPGKGFVAANQREMPSGDVQSQFIVLVYRDAGKYDIGRTAMSLASLPSLTIFEIAWTVEDLQRGRNLNIPKTICVGSEQRYLYAIIYHKGEIGSAGHYTAAVLQTVDNERVWWYFDDSNVKKPRFLDDNFNVYGMRIFMVLYCEQIDKTGLAEIAVQIPKTYEIDESIEQIALISTGGLKFLFPRDLVTNFDRLQRSAMNCTIEYFYTDKTPHELYALWQAIPYVMEETFDKIPKLRHHSIKAKIRSLMASLGIEVPYSLRPTIKEVIDMSDDEPPPPPPPKPPTRTSASNRPLPIEPEIEQEIKGDTSGTTVDIGSEIFKPRKKHRQWNLLEYENPLFLLGHQYKAQVETSRGVYYYCVNGLAAKKRGRKQETCKASVVYDRQSKRYRMINPTHTCGGAPKDLGEAERRLRLHMIVDELSSELKTRQEIEQAVLKVQEREHVALLVGNEDLRYLSNIIYKNGSRVRGKLTESRLAKTYHQLCGQEFLLQECSVPTILLFMLESSARWQNTAREMAIVGRENTSLPEGFRNIYVGFTIKEERATPCFWLLANEVDQALWSLVFYRMRTKRNLQMQNIQIITFDFGISMKYIPRATGNTFEVENVRTTKVSYVKEIQRILGSSRLSDDEDAQRLLGLCGANVVEIGIVESELKRKKRRDFQQLMTAWSALTAGRHNTFVHAIDDVMRTRLSEWMANLEIPQTFDELMNSIRDYQQNLTIDGTTEL